VGPVGQVEITACQSGAGEHKLAATMREPGSPSAKSADIVFSRDEGHVFGYKTKFPTDFVVRHFRVSLNVFQKTLITLRLQFLNPGCKLQPGDHFEFHVVLIHEYRCFYFVVAGGRCFHFFQSLLCPCVIFLGLHLAVRLWF
jgi:hypothetical protein